MRLEKVLKVLHGIFFLVVILSILSLLSIVIVYPNIGRFATSYLFVPYLGVVIACLILVLRDFWRGEEASYGEIPNRRSLLGIGQIFMIVSIIFLIQSLYIYLSETFWYADINLPQISYYVGLRASVLEEIQFRVLLIGVVSLIIALITRTKDRGWFNYLWGGGFEMNFKNSTLVFVSALIFGYLHVSLYGIDPVWGAIRFFVGFSGGLAMGYLYLRYGVHASILLHFMVNFWIGEAPELLLPGIGSVELQLLIQAIFCAGGIIYLGKLISRVFREYHFLAPKTKTRATVMTVLVAFCAIMCFQIVYYKQGSYPVSIESGRQEKPEIYRDLVVWEDNRDMKKDDVYLHNLSSGETMPIFEGYGYQLNPNIWNNTIVWIDLRGGEGNRAIYAYNITNETAYKIYQGELIAGLDISGGNVVWAEKSGEEKIDDISFLPWKYRKDEPFLALPNRSQISGEMPEDAADAVDAVSPDGLDVLSDLPSYLFYSEPFSDNSKKNSNEDDWDICLYNLKQEKLFHLTDAEGDQVQPRIHSNRVVWCDASGDDADIYWCDLFDPEREPKIVCNATGDQIAPDVWGDVVVWQDNRDGRHYDIYAYDFAREEEIPICTKIGDQVNPKICGNLIVWEDGGYRDDSDIFAYDLETHKEYWVCGIVDQQYGASVWGNTIVWQDERGLYGPDIYAANFDVIKNQQEFFSRVNSEKIGAVKQKNLLSSTYT
jgi:beta propeller repeat protein